jgi:hypothetical protein
LPPTDAFPHFLLMPTLLVSNGSKREKFPVTFPAAAAHYATRAK